MFRRGAWREDSSLIQKRRNLFGLDPGFSFEKLHASRNTSIHIGCFEVRPVQYVRDIGVILDNQLNMRKHMSQVASTCFFHLRRLRQLRASLSREQRQRLASVIYSFSSGLLERRSRRIASVLPGPAEALSSMMWQGLLPIYILVDHVTGTLRDLSRIRGIVASYSRLARRETPGSIPTSTKKIHHDIYSPRQEKILCCCRSTSSWSCDRNTTRFLYIGFRAKLEPCIQIVRVDACVCRWCCAGRNMLTSVTELPDHSHLRFATSGLHDVPRTWTKFGSRSFSVAGPTA